MLINWYLKEELPQFNTNTFIEYSLFLKAFYVLQIYQECRFKSKFSFDIH